ncbi:MAG: RluA family pseudouridine synthase [Pseudomonadota bacterium]|nr:RluA family pseudouridine synthase [Pseudomonadota bacterium]
MADEEEDGDFDSGSDEEQGAGAAAPPEARRIPAELAGLRADLVLGRLYPEYSRSRLQDWMRAGRVHVDGGVVGQRDKLWTGQLATIEPPPPAELGEILPEAIALQLVHEDDTLMVVHKPAGLVVHPGNGNRSGTLQNALLHHDPALAGVPRAGIVHRLDKDTSGLMVVARTLSAHIDLVRQLQARTVRRHYAAVVSGQPAGDGFVDAPIGRHPTQRTRMAVVRGGRPARTWYVLQRQLGGCALLECRLETGRTHQIRVHMQHIGHPMIGDPVYGPSAAVLRTLPPAARSFPRQALHAFRLGLVHPASGADLQWEIPLEPDLQALLEQLAT